MMCPDWIRSRIRVAAFAPAAYIDDYLCHSVVHYVSKGDKVHKLDIAGRRRCRHTTIELDRHPDAKGGLDHSFNSPTFKPKIRFVIDSYMDDLRGGRND